ncbi:MAG: hypothetical protein VXY77_00610 [Pseudomonadota bacterium]|nr:hypothetical protein [Pseudomonadota bacterium]
MVCGPIGGQLSRFDLNRLQRAMMCDQGFESEIPRALRVRTTLKKRAALYKNARHIHAQSWHETQLYVNVLIMNHGDMLLLNKVSKGAV